MGKTYATETVEIHLGTDWYYNHIDDAVKFIRDADSKFYRVTRYEHAPKVPNGFTSRTKYVLLGLSFEPQEFWKKPVDEQLTELKGAILECDLLAVVSKRRSNCLKRYFIQPTGTPYDGTLEEKFENAVWRILRKKYSISFNKFETSLRAMLIPEDKLYSAPLIVYFADKLAPRYEFHYNGTNEWNRVLIKVIKRRSKFEILTSIQDDGEVVYAKK